MKIELSKEEISNILREQGLIKDNQVVNTIRRSQYRMGDSIVLFIDYKKKKGKNDKM